MPGPLEGLVVIDLTRVLAGPFCTMLLGDLGARVVKLERPGSGDDSRAFGPFVNGESAYFMSLNRGKESATINLKSPEAVELLWKLIDKADILVENFKPGIMDKLGFTFERVSRRNPKLIYAASSGFGRTGPYSSRPAYDLIIQGMSGMMSITGPDENTPTKVGSSIADIFAGVFTTIGILAALHARERTGRGQLVDVAMLDCMVAILENAISRFTATGINPVPIGNTHPSISPFMTLKTSDGSFNVACGNDMLFARFCSIIEMEQLLNDPRFLTNPDRVNHVKELWKLLEASTVKKSTQEWLAALGKGGVPAGPINSVSDVISDVQIQAREMIVELFHPKTGNLKVPGIPIKFSDTIPTIEKPAPLTGEHNRSIYCDFLGLSEGELERLKTISAI